MRIEVETASSIISRTMSGYGCQQLADLVSRQDSLLPPWPLPTQRHAAGRIPVLPVAPILGLVKMPEMIPLMSFRVHHESPSSALALVSAWIC